MSFVRHFRKTALALASTLIITSFSGIVAPTIQVRAEDTTPTGNQGQTAEEKAVADKAAADKVTAEIAALKNKTITLDLATAIKHARTDYEALTVDQKVLIPQDDLKILTDSENTIKTLQEKKDADDKAAAAAKAEEYRKAREEGWNGDYIIALDPGHDVSHAGAGYFGTTEESLNLRIAQYCQVELSTYPHIKVVMTRTSAACPNGGGENKYCLEGRVKRAASAGADAFISFHLNSDGGNGAHGATVYYPNGNYVGHFSTEGNKLASNILSNLTALGLQNNGLRTRTMNEDQYPDGSIQDYYSVIRNAKLNGMPGIIIEHAYLSNAGDYTNFLDTDAKLQAIGIADAKSIVEYCRSNCGHWVIDTLGNSRYYYGDTNMYTGWLQLGTNWYYLDPNTGIMARDTYIGEYHINKDGIWDTSERAGMWKHNSTGWWYQYTDNSYPKSAWEHIKGAWYYFDNRGYMIANSWVGNYYLTGSGAMATNTWIDRWHVNVSGLWDRTDASGKWILNKTGWWFKYGNGGYPANKWESIGHRWYYFNSNGYMAHDEYVGGYWLSGSGAWSENWGNGHWTNDANGKTYQDGTYTPTNCWMKIDSNWYYFNADGHVAVNTYIGSWHVNSDGVWDK